MEHEKERVTETKELTESGGLLTFSKRCPSYFLFAFMYLFNRIFTYIYIYIFANIFIFMSFCLFVCCFRFSIPLFSRAF